MNLIKLLQESGHTSGNCIRLALLLCIIFGTIPASQAAQAVTLPPQHDAFVSSTATTGNRRMMFVGTYTDTTICSPTEGCPPVYQNSRALMKFPLSLPTNTLPVSAQLKIYHYGSNANLDVTVSRITQDWNETSVTYPGPLYEGSYGSSLITNYNTTDPALIREDTIDINPGLISQLIQNNFGFLLRPTNGQDVPGLVFCSKDSDGFCQIQHTPKLIVNYIPNNTPNVPVLVSPANGTAVSGNCDESVEPQTGTCRDIVSATFQLNNVGDTDPVPGDLDKTVIDFSQNGTIVRSSEPILGTGSVSWTGSFAEGTYQWKARSIDKAGMWSGYSPEWTVQFDSTPPEVPVIGQLPQTINITEPVFQISGDKTTDNISTAQTIAYQLSFSNDATFQSGITTSAWQQDNPIFQQNTNGLNLGQPYYFRIKAKDAAGNISNWSEPTSTTIIDAGTIGIPTIDKTGWGIADGILADGLKPERSRLTSGYVYRSPTLMITGKAEKDRSVEVFINDKIAETITPICTASESTCNYKYTLKFTDNGTSNSTGVPTNSYTLQVRAITKTGRTSPLSAKEIIYHDTTPPILPEVNVTSNNISLIDAPLTKESQMVVDTRTERYSDIIYMLTAPNGKTIETRIWRSPYNRSSRLTSNMTMDGTYTLTVKATDAAGNTSQPKLIKITRDTTPPAKPTVEPYLCDNNVCLKVTGEQNTKILVNNQEKGLLASQPQPLTALENWEFGKTYIFTVQSKDVVGNVSEVVNCMISAPKAGIGDIEGTSFDKPYAQFPDFVQTPAKMRVTIDELTGMYEISNVYIPAPVLTFQDRKTDDWVDLYGFSLEKNHPLDIETIEKHLSFNEAKNHCKKGWFDSLDKACIEKKMGIQSIDEWLKSIKETCKKKWFWQSWDCEDTKNNEKSITSKGVSRVSIPHIQVSIFKSDKTNLDSFWMADKTTFMRSLNIKGRLDTGTVIKGRTIVFGDTNVFGKKIDYRGLTSDFGPEQKLTEVNTTFPSPVGFPLRNFRLDRSYPEYFKSGADIICSKINCNSQGTRGDFIISRGANLNGHGPSDIDLAPYAYNSNLSPVVVATHDGKLILDRDGYSYPPIIKVNNIAYKDTLHANNLEVKVVSPSGTITWYSHLNPNSDKLSFWANKTIEPQVVRGDVVGFVGETGKATGPHLHYSIAGHSTDEFYKTFYAPRGLSKLPEELPNIKNKNLVDNYINEFLSNKDDIPITF